MENCFFLEEWPLSSYNLPFCLSSAFLLASWIQVAFLEQVYKYHFISGEKKIFLIQNLFIISTYKFWSVCTYVLCLWYLNSCVKSFKRSVDVIAICNIYLDFKAYIHLYIDICTHMLLRWQFIISFFVFLLVFTNNPVPSRQ